MCKTSNSTRTWKTKVRQPNNTYVRLFSRRRQPVPIHHRHFHLTQHNRYTTRGSFASEHVSTKDDWFVDQIGQPRTTSWHNPTWRMHSLCQRPGRSSGTTWIRQVCRRALGSVHSTTNTSRTLHPIKCSWTLQKHTGIYSNLESSTLLSPNRCMFSCPHEPGLKRLSWRFAPTNTYGLFRLVRPTCMLKQKKTKKNILRVSSPRRKQLKRSSALGLHESSLQYNGRGATSDRIQPHQTNDSKQ